MNILSVEKMARRIEFPRDRIAVRDSRAWLAAYQAMIRPELRAAASAIVFALEEDPRDKPL